MFRRVNVGWYLAASAALMAAGPAGLSAQANVTQEATIARSVLQSPQMQRAMAYVDASDSETIQEWKSICNAYAPSAPQSQMSQRGYGDEINRSRLLYKLFRIYGLEDVHIDDALNVIGIRRGTGGGPTVVLNAHHDNVALWPSNQPIEAFVADGRMWCPAAGDDIMGVVQMLTVLRALNAGKVTTKGDIWFVGFTGEESGSPGAEEFVRENYPLNLDWRKGDILVQFHGGGGEGITTGSSPYIQMSKLRVFVPLDFDRWRTDAVDALAPIIDRVNKELRDPRSTQVSEYETGQGELTSDLLYLNTPMIQGNVIPNGTTSEATVRFDLRSPSDERLYKADRDIMRIAADVTRQMGPGFTYQYEVTMKLGAPGIPGWNKLDNPPARMAAAATQVLYGTRAIIDSTRGCGDCRRAYMEGMPAFSLRGNVIDYGEGGKFNTHPGPQRLVSETRLKTSGHDVTESAEIDRVWSGVKHGLLFAVAYAGLQP
jgi:tripeptide aminopeptidase